MQQFKIILSGCQIFGIILLIVQAPMSDCDLLEEYVKYVDSVNKPSQKTIVSFEDSVRVNSRHIRAIELSENENYENPMLENTEKLPASNHGQMPNSSSSNRRSIEPLLLTTKSNLHNNSSNNESHSYLKSDRNTKNYQDDLSGDSRDNSPLFFNDIENEVIPIFEEFRLRKSERTPRAIKLNDNKRGKRMSAGKSRIDRRKRRSMKLYNSLVIRNKSKTVEHRAKRDISDYDQWTHSEVLDGAGLVVLRWQPRHQEILFRIEAKTRGWIGIGFSPDGKMEGADIVFGWVDDRSGKAFLYDCHGVSQNLGSAPVRDEIDNYTLMRGIQNDSHTILEFRRVLDTCDPNDYVLTTDTVRVIWALRDTDPQNEDEMTYHEQNRGVQSLHLLGPPPVAQYPTRNVKNWDITLNNFEVRSNMNTIYWCKVFKAPMLNVKHHIIGYEPLIGPNHTKFVHHMIVHECHLGPEGNNRQWETYAQQNGQLCYGQEMPREWERCLTPFIAWAVGSKGENFPEQVGLPLAQHRNSYYMLEVHFDNPSMSKARDTSGLRLRYTSEVRDNDGGIMIAGVALSTLHFIPPQQVEYKTAGYCSTGCTREVFPKDGVNVVSVMLHSHLAGRRLRLRHIRSGKELPPLAQDNHYDFNYQQTRTLSQNTLILPGDGLITECVYSTMDRTKPTLGGYSTKEEMCLAFILHYPRTELAGCYSMPPIQYFFQNLGVREFYGKNMTEIEALFLQGESDTPVPPSTPSPPLFRYNPGDEMSPEANRKAIIALKNAKDYTIDGDTSDSQSMFDQLIIKEPLEFQNKSFMSHLQNIPYNESLITKKIEEYFYTGLHLTFCRKRDDSLAIKENIEKLPNFTTYVDKESQMQCSYKLRRSPSTSAKFEPNIILSILIILMSIFNR